MLIAVLKTDTNVDLYLILFKLIFNAFKKSVLTLTK